MLVIKILRSKSGASLAFVLVLMFLLLIIGGSILADAGSAMGVNIMYQQGVRLDTYMESIVKSMNSSMTKVNPASIASSGLGMGIVEEVVSKATSASPSKVADFEVELTLPKEISGMKTKPVKMTFKQQYVQIIPKIEAVISSDGTVLIAEEPSKAYVSMLIEAAFEGELGGNIQTGLATYRYSGGEFEQEGGVWKLTESGKWEVLRYAKYSKRAGS